MKTAAAERGVEGTADDIALARQLDLAASRDGKIDAFEQAKAMLTMRDSTRHEIVDLDRYGQTILAFGVLGTEAIAEHSVVRGNRSRSRHQTAARHMAHRELEARHMEFALLTVVRHYQRGVPKTDRLEKSSSAFALAHLARDLGDAARGIDAAAHDGHRLGDFGFPGFINGSHGTISRRLRHRQRATLEIATVPEQVRRPVGRRQLDARLQQVDPRRRDTQ